MNLDEIRFYRKLLKLQKTLCCTLALTTLLSLPSSSCKKNNSNNISMSSSISLDKNSRDLLSIPIIKAIASYKARQVLNYMGDAINVVVNNVEMASDYIYSMFELSYEEKMQIIMEREGITYEELDEVCAGCVAESCEDGNNYNEGYNIASTIDNRTNSISTVNYVSSLKNGADGNCLHCQFEAKNQFAVYAHRSYEKYLGRIDLKAYQGAIDMFYSGIPSHDCLKFNNEPPEKGSYEHFEDNGNYYYKELKDSDRIDKNDIDYNVVENDNMKRVLEKNNSR